jgi:eukaryotic-like serine/threonine-protein kinase
MNRGSTMGLGGIGGDLPREVMGYEVIDFVGEGAGSLLYAVNHPQTKQIYALKHVTPKTDRDQRFVEQLENEYEVGRLVRHPALRRSIEMKVNRTLFRKVTEAALVLELFDGQPLDRQVPKRVAGTVSIFIQTAEALDALHAIGYVHCDLKPNNILVSNDGDVKVIDLGQACPKGKAKTRIQGTPDYIAPEQVKCEAVSVATDVYNFGATLYWALCGKNLPTLFTLKRSENSFLLDQKLPSPRDLNPVVPEALSNLVMECVRTNPAKRPQGMRDVILRLEIIQHVLKKRHSSSGMQPALV